MDKKGQINIIPVLMYVVIVGACVVIGGMLEGTINVSLWSPVTREVMVVFMVWGWAMYSVVRYLDNIWKT